MSNIPSRITVDIQQIADIARVGRSAVGNWRKRHSDFPVPDATGRFDVQEVERWLIENGKIDSRVPPAYMAWALADKLRDTLVADDTASLLIAVLVYLHACASPSLFTHSNAPPLKIPASAAWRHVRESAPDALSGALVKAARAIEDANPALDGLMTPGLSAASFVGGKLLYQLIDTLDRASDDATAYFELFEGVVRRASELDRFRGEFSTPDDLTELMTRLAGQLGGAVLDPACGHGGLLLSAAVHPDRQTPELSKFIGYEIGIDVLRVARSRFFLYGIAADLRQADVFRVPKGDLPKADLVLIDPPLNVPDWGDAAVYLDERWSFGVPPRKSANFAWLQLAVHCLRGDGRAIVVSTARTTFSGGPEAQIRRAMLEAGVVEAVVHLPSRLRADTSVPLVLWILRPPREGRDDVLMVDASALGTAGRSQRTFDEAVIERIVDAVTTRGQSEGGEIAMVIETAELIENDAILEPSRYRPEHETDTEEIRRRATELRSSLPDASAEAAVAVGRLVTRLNSGWRL